MKYVNFVASSILSAIRTEILANPHTQLTHFFFPFASVSDMLESTYNFTWCHNPEDFIFLDLHQHVKYRVIRNDCRGFNNLSYTVHMR